MRFFIALVVILAPAVGFAQMGPPVAQVEVTNFPDPQNVSGTVAVSNLPGQQEVTGEVQVSNFPSVQDVAVRNDDREQVEIQGTLTPDDGLQTGLIFGPNRQTIPLLSVPVGMKLVLTDLLAHHNIVGEAEVMSLNIQRAAADTNCADGPVGLRWQLRVEPGSGTSVNLTTGLEYLGDEQVCLVTGGAAVNPNLGISFTLVGYLTPL